MTQTAEPAADKRVILLTADLMASAQLEGQIRRAGLRPVTVPTLERALEAAATGVVVAMVAELTQPGLDIGLLLQLGHPVIVYASHVREAELQAAQSAGAQALSRGQAAAQLGTLLMELIRPSAT